MLNKELEKKIDEELKSDQFQDYAPNGLQVEGKREIKKIITGVTASQALLDTAVARNADAVLVHHGYFWKNEPVVICGMKHRRLKTLLTHDINLYAYHLPLDAHPSLGNNAKLAELLGITSIGMIDPLVPYGEFEVPADAIHVKEILEKKLQRQVLHCGDSGPVYIKRIAWCTGGGQGYLQKAAEFGVDAFITGEVSEQTVHIAREMELHFYAAGHHATERYGIQALGEWLAKCYLLEVFFIDVPNPA
ncbi:type 2 GTP cyclohydrolase I [Candidatus Williamhamiltonella defendens]|uniref:type 2 GTP cyclohydrolase I n=1 Tax=Candidatus Williamhamiltonella defendens TaxID=138072 RepID=UPI00130EC4AF|nr:type 2 GTP cyclohydrolase I [Candidatus Hamiltonella defensa]